MSSIHPPIRADILEKICKIIADTTKGLTGSEINNLLSTSKIPIVGVSNTKWRKLYDSFISFQNTKNYSNDILKFIQIAIHPARFIEEEERFEDLRFDLNKILSFIGLELKETGRFTVIEQSQTISEAEERAHKLIHKLKQRNAHEKIYVYCKAELLANNYFHSVFEAVKSVADRIREKSGLTQDGNTLIERAFSINTPRITINNLISETEINEHKGFINLLKGIFGMFRNTIAHTPRITWEINEQDALDIMSLISLVHRKLDI